jgi:hypothetical protein
MCFHCFPDPSEVWSYQMIHTSVRVIGTLLAILAMAGASAFAQGGGSTSALSGTVTDSSGAVIPGATVVVKNIATSSEFQAVSSDEGTFTVPALNPGGYTVTVSLMGFKTAVLNDVRVNAGVPATVTVKLEVGGLEETVVVEGGASVIQTQTAAVATTIDVNQIAKLPTGSRSALEFVTSLPGVNTPAGSRDSTVNGLPQGAINITIDGMSAQDNHLKTSDGFFSRVSPRLDAVEEVTVSTAAQSAATTGQGAVQIQFTTRSGTNQYRGSSYYYLQHHKLNANTWFNNRDLAPDPATGKAPKAEDVLHQPGTRIGGPISIPGLFNGRDKAFFFFNYEESRSPGQNAENRTILHPSAERGIFRYLSGGQIVERNLLDLAGSRGLPNTIDPTIGALLADIRSSTAQGTVSDLADPITQQLRYQYKTDSITRYPTGRLDFNVTDRHRLTGSFNYNKLLSTPDTTNNREPNFPGFPGTGNQHSSRYTMQGTVRSTLTSNLVNEFKIGRTGGATKFAPEISPAQFTGPLANQDGFHLDINGDFLGITNAHSTGSYSAREAGTKVVENTLSWIKGAHNVQMGGGFTQADVWLENQQHVPTITFGVDADDTAAQAMFTAANFPGASTAQLNDARELYATLTGRVIGIAAEARLDEKSNEYRLLGLGVQRARLRDLGLFFADSWRVRPNLTVNYGVRYQLQSPFTPVNDSYSNATYADVCGVSGVSAQGGCNLFQPGVLGGKRPEFVQFNKGEGAYNTDWNNWAPSLGFAYTLNGQGGILGTILGREEGDSVVRAGYALAYDRPGTSDFTGGIDDNPGIAISATRTVANGRLGTPGSILLRNRADVRPAAVPTTRVYPMTDIVTEDVHIYDPNLQVPYSQTWTAGWQRKLNRDMAIEARYVGTRSLQAWTEYNYNEINIVENGFLDEFRRAQQNLQANIAANRASDGFKYTGIPGTSPLPIFLAYFTGAASSSAGNPLAYTGTLWNSATFRDPMAMFNPQPFTAANALDADEVRRANALRAGLAANFLVANPDLLGGAEVTGNGGYTKYNSLQLEFRKRLSHGFQFQTNYVFGKAYTNERYSFRRPNRQVAQTGVLGGVTHAMKANFVVEAPFGRGRRFFSAANGVLDRIIGGWELNGIATVQTGRELDFGNVRLMGMSKDEFQDAFKLRFDDANKVVYMLPQDIIDNTVAAFDVNATSSTGYGSRGVPQGRYLAPANGPDCIELAQTNAVNGYGDCGVNNLIVRGPRLVRFDLSAVKRTQISGRVNFEFRAEMLNAFNTPWFTPVTGLNTNNLYNTPNDFRVTGADSGREVQLVWRINW